MPFIKELNNDFKIVNNHFELSSDYLKKNCWRFKKITGTRFFSIVGNDPNAFSSPVKTWCQMVGIYTEPMDPMLARVGQIVEPKVRQYVEEKLNIKYKCYDPAQVKWDVFHENKIFGGIPDGEPMNNKNEVDYSLGMPMLEIKTSSIDKFVYRKNKGCMELQKNSDGSPQIKEIGAKKKSWYDTNNNFKISNEYKFQIGLYMYLRNINNGMFAVIFLDKNDYLHPEEVDVNKREIVLRKISLADGIKTIKPYIDKAKEWYEKYILTGVSPEMSDNDKQWLKDVELIK